MQWWTHYGPLVALVPAGVALATLWPPLYMLATVVLLLVVSPLPVVASMLDTLCRVRCARCDTNMGRARFAYHNRWVTRMAHLPPAVLGALAALLLVTGLFVVSPAPAGMCVLWVGIALLMYAAHVHKALKVGGWCPACRSLDVDSSRGG